MARPPDSGKLNLAKAFARVQTEMLAQLSTGTMFEHPSAAGTASEQCWLQLFERYLPKRYRAAPAFVIDSRGRRSRQIDLAIFDNLYSPLLFPHESGLHVAAESVYAVFEVKPFFSGHHIRYAAEKAASVRALKRTSVSLLAGGKKSSAIEPRPILAGLLATTSDWPASKFEKSLRATLSLIKPSERLDIGCALDRGSFEYNGTLKISPPERALAFFFLRLADRLRACGTAPAADLNAYLDGMDNEA